ncbi:MAG: hypothetical protein JW850_22625 [Thermoflexales bacterium]|nr:hypothetical protein [Thermoflexales bacterium]
MKKYTFCVARDAEQHRIELRADQTLADLHEAIQAAYGREAAQARSSRRSYSFFVSGQAWDESSEYTVLREGRWAKTYEKAVLPPLDERQRASIEWRLAKKFGTTPDITDEVLAALQKPVDGPGDVRTTRIADLGLELGQEFLYLFDYADEQRFVVRVEAVEDR